MTDFNRPDPDELLRKIQQKEQEKERIQNNHDKKGRLKIFLGFCAGVGKTYSMLEEARLAKRNGLDVAIGLVETHKRKETEALLEGLEIIPREQILYNGITLEEMALDEILQRKPEIVIVDELAHTNVPGSRHEKRYQDVIEILKAGINVYSTLNIQHIESMIDIVQQISEITIHETVPDSILETADEIELIDLTPEKLLERLSEGKVYVPEKAKQAMQKFFRKGNLLALRELALKYTAKQVDEEMLSYKKQHEITSPWAINSKLLVGISSSPTSQNLLRMTHRLATQMKAQWYAVYVESPQQVQASEDARSQLAKNIRLAEDLGATIAALNGTVIADTILDFAKEKNVTLIVAGLSYRSKMEEILKGSVLNELVKKSGEIDILLVGHNPQSKPPKRRVSYSFDAKPYLYGSLNIAIFIGICMLLRQWFDPVSSSILLLLPIIINSLTGGNRVGLYSAVVSILAVDFFFINPTFSFAISDLKYLPSLIMFIIVALISSLMSEGLRHQTESAKHREMFLASLNNFTRDIMKAKSKNEIVKKASEHISDAFNCEVAILLPDDEDQLELEYVLGETEFDEKEKAVSIWVFRNGLVAGKKTQTLTSAKWHHLPIKAEENTFGVISINPRNEERFLSPEQQRLLESFANILAIYIQKNICELKL